MNTKTCDKCGWVCPGDSPARSCPICRTKFSVDYCVRCGEASTNMRGGLCRKCQSEEHSQWEKQHVIDGEERFTEWKARLAAQPNKTLTEAQWLEACRYFGGCAYCENPEIAARSMFIEFKDGGRYAAWNIVPACERCETLIKARPNPFIRLNRSLNRDKDSAMRKGGYAKDTLSRITEYLQSRMEVQNND